MSPNWMKLTIKLVFNVDFVSETSFNAAFLTEKSVSTMLSGASVEEPG